MTQRDQAKAKGRGAEAEIQLDEIVSDYAGKRDEMERKVRALQASGGSAMEDMKEGAGRALDELTAALEKAKSRFSRALFTTRGGKNESFPGGRASH